MLTLLAACAPSVPIFPRFERDTGLECGEEDSGLGECPGTQICLQNRCYARCSASSPCGPRETCSAAGVCVAGASDGGMPDAPPPDACTAAMCMAPTPFCRAGICIACNETGGCGGPTPICDLGRGVCVSFAPEVCAPCNNDMDCGGAGVPMRCVARDRPTERTCMPTCSMSSECPQGFSCEVAMGFCRPILGSCTGLRAALERRVCAGDADCAPVGADTSTGLFEESCFDDRPPSSTTCHHPCGQDRDCPTGQMCDGRFCTEPSGL